MIRLACLSILGAFLLSTSSPVWAEEKAAASAVQLEKAKLRYFEAEAFYQARDYQNAIEAYEESYELSQKPSLLYNVAQCYRLMQEEGRAYHYYKRFLKAATPAEAEFARLADEYLAMLTPIVKTRRLQTVSRVSTILGVVAGGIAVGSFVASKNNDPNDNDAPLLQNAVIFGVTADVFLLSALGEHLIVKKKLREQRKSLQDHTEQAALLPELGISVSLNQLSLSLHF